MKRTILASIVGLAAMAAATMSYGQGKVVLDNYDSTAAGGNVNQTITYGAGSGGTAGTGISGSQWTIGWYWALGTQTVSSDPTGTADPSTLGGGLAFDNNDPNDTAKISSAAGYYINTSPGLVEGYSSGTITLEMVAYDGASYGSSTHRGHSSAFTLTPATGNNTPPLTGDAMPTFSVFTVAAVPEPSILALSGIGAAALMLIRRKK